MVMLASLIKVSSYLKKIQLSDEIGVHHLMIVFFQIHETVSNEANIRGWESLF